MKVDIISGFLGAGKTTLIKKLLDTLVKDQKVAIVENEYGEVGIDGDLLKDRRIEVKEINSGCICCTIKGDFKQNILDIISNYRPDRIIIEPSGVANFSQVLESIKEAHIEGLRINMKITMVDAQNVHMYMKNFGDFYRSQLVNANTIILTRVEKLSDKEITHVCNEIKTINNKANIITTELSKLSPERIIQVSEKKVENLIENINIKKPKRIGLRRVSAPKFFENWGVETPKTFEYSELVKILNEFQNNKHGEVLRAKGIIKSKDNKWFKFDFVPNDISIVNYKSDYTGRVCVIGRNLNKDSIDKLFS
ncbi:GTP-binding protein [Clostridium perfringens]